MKLNGRRAFVTGGGRGIGKGIAQKLLLEGAKVYICDRDESLVDETCTELSVYGTILGGVGDVSVREQMSSQFQQAADYFDGLDILINNAGIARFEPFVTISDDSWNRTMQVNANGVFICSQLAVPYLKSRGAGAIVNVSSTNGLLGEAKLAHYNASKAAILLLTKTMAIELAALGIRCNCVCPGVIQTDLASNGGLNDEGMEHYLARIPMNRRGSVQEVANACAFLASDEASFITGTELVVDGGQTCQQ